MTKPTDCAQVHLLQNTLATILKNDASLLSVMWLWWKTESFRSCPFWNCTVRLGIYSLGRFKSTSDSFLWWLHSIQFSCIRYGMFLHFSTFTPKPHIATRVENHAKLEPNVIPPAWKPHSVTCAYWMKRASWVRLWNGCPVSQSFSEVTFSSLSIWLQRAVTEAAQ